MKSVHSRSYSWSTFSHILTEYGEILRISPYSVRMLENVDQNYYEYKHFSRSAIFSIKDVWQCSKYETTNIHFVNKETQTFFFICLQKVVCLTINRGKVRNWDNTKWPSGCWLQVTAVRRVFYEFDHEFGKHFLHWPLISRWPLQRWPLLEVPL